MAPTTRARALLALAALLSPVPLGAGCGPAAPPTWSTVVGPVAPMILSVWGSGPDDVWAVGGTCNQSMCAATSQAAIYHFDGKAWSEKASPKQAVLWWVFGYSPRDVWISGEQGTLLHYDGTAITQVPSGVESDKVNVKLFGCWGAAPGDLWVAGGVPDGSGAVLHGGLGGFSQAAGVPPIGGTWYKVWGSTADDVILVGQQGSLARYDGKTWTKVDLGGAGVTSRDGLFTAAGRSAGDVYVVGGTPAQGLALHFDGTGWAPVPGLKLDGVPLLTGVHENPGGDLVLCGLYGAKFAGRAGAWRDDSRVKPSADLHAAWFNAADDVYLAGGNFFALRDGVVAHYSR